MTAAVCALLVMILSGLTALAASPEHRFNTWQNKDQSKDKQSGPPAAEQSAMAKIEAAPDAAAKLVAAGEFLKKYPKSTLRPKIAAYVAQETNKIGDSAQRIAQLENMLTVFKEPSDSAVISPILLDSYFSAGRVDDGFRVATAYLAKNPNDVAVLTQTMIEGVEQAKKNNPKYVQQSQQYGIKAIELIESGKKPDTFDDARWSEYQTRWLPVLYQSLGLVSMITGNKADSRAKLEKALSLNAGDPFSYVLLGSMLNDEYQQLAQQHKALTPGPLRDSVLKQAHVKLDEVIDMFAHAVALSEGDTRYKELHDQILKDLEAYYKYRHGASSDGLPQLIEKYKKK